MTAIVPTPAAPTVPEFPGLGDATFNAKAYVFGVAMPGVSDGIHALAEAAETNAAAANERAVAAQASADDAGAQAGAATTKAGEASESATASADSAADSAGSAAAAEASRIQASKLNLGAKAAPPTVDNQGEALLTGATYYDTALDKWRVWTGSAWGDGISAIAGVASVNGQTGIVILTPADVGAASESTILARMQATSLCF